MEQAKLVGVGFMGRPDRVARLLNKVVENANLDPGFPLPGNRGHRSFSGKRSITGFFLGFTKNGLNLSLIERCIGPHADRTNQRTTHSMTYKENSLH